MILPKVSKRPGLKVNRKKKKKGHCLGGILHTSTDLADLVLLSDCCEQNYAVNKIIILGQCGI